jgi:hypothetical protein
VAAAIVRRATSECTKKAFGSLRACELESWGLVRSWPGSGVPERVAATASHKLASYQALKLTRGGLVGTALAGFPVFTSDAVE